MSHYFAFVALMTVLTRPDTRLGGHPRHEDGHHDRI
jgi:hypothetical protein